MATVDDEYRIRISHWLETNGSYFVVARALGANIRFNHSTRRVRVRDKEGSFEFTDDFYHSGLRALLLPIILQKRVIAPQHHDHYGRSTYTLKSYYDNDDEEEVLNELSSALIRGNYNEIPCAKYFGGDFNGFRAPNLSVSLVLADIPQGVPVSVDIKRTSAKGKGIHKNFQKELEISMLKACEGTGYSDHWALFILGVTLKGKHQVVESLKTEIKIRPMRKAIIKNIMSQPRTYLERVRELFDTCNHGDKRTRVMMAVYSQRELLIKESERGILHTAR